MRLFQHILLLTLCTYSLKSFSSEEEVKKRIYNHLTIRDYLSAVQEGRKAIAEFPDSFAVHAALIEALCKKGDETEALELWQNSCAFSQEKKMDKRIIELLAWGVLNKGENSFLLNVQFYALLGAAFTRDAKAIPLLIELMRSSNALVRSVAIKVCVPFGDSQFKQEIMRLLKEEKVWYVRLEVIRAIGALHLTSLKNDLKEIIANPKTLVEEKMAAIGALVTMYDAIDREELVTLAASNRSGIRQLLCDVISHLNLYEHLDLLLPLLNDTSPDVRIAAINTLALLRVQQVKEIRIAGLLKKNLHNDAPEVSITAAYALLLLNEKEAEITLEKWLKSESPQWRRMASAALSISGVYGIKLSLKQFKEAQDPYVKANIAIGLISQRVLLHPACDALYNVLLQGKEQMWMWENHFNPLFNSLAPSEVKHIEQIPHYPQVVDQLVRLDILSMLSIVRYPKAQEAVKEFLQTRSWGVTGAAVMTLLREGDEKALDAVQALLQDPDPSIRVQAALIMTLVSSDTSATKVLQDIYPHVDREMKVHILEAIAHAGDPQSIPFLLDILKEPFQLLRFVAASALIQCLYH